MKKYIFFFTFFLLIFSTMAMAAEESVSYSDAELVKWNHPVKTVLAANNVELLGVEIENKTDFTFFVQFNKELKLENQEYFEKIVQSIAKEVNFNNFKIFDDEKEISITVTCVKGAIKEVLYNEAPDYFKKLRAFSEKEKQLNQLLLTKIPELNDLAKMVAQNSQGNAKMSVYISAEPDAEGADKYEKEYYLVAIDQVQGDEQKPLDEFIVHKDTAEILWNDGQKYINLADWRKLSAEKPYWPGLFKVVE